MRMLLLLWCVWAARVAAVQALDLGVDAVGWFLLFSTPPTLTPLETDQRGPTHQEAFNNPSGGSWWAVAAAEARTMRERASGADREMQSA